MSEITENFIGVSGLFFVAISCVLLLPFAFSGSLSMALLVTCIYGCALGVVEAAL